MTRGLLLAVTLILNIYLCTGDQQILAPETKYDSMWAHTMSRFAAATYCPLIDILAWNCTACVEVFPNTLLIGAYEDRATRALAYVAVNTYHNTTFVVFRGGEGVDLAGWIARLSTNRAGTSFLEKDVLVDAEFALAYASVTIPLQKLIKDARLRFPFFQIAITG
jgi:hypothetical protein